MKDLFVAQELGMHGIVLATMWNQAICVVP